MENNKAVLQCYTEEETHLAIKKVAKLKRLSVSKLIENLIIPYTQNYLEEYEREQLVKQQELRKLRGY